jgi:hypothetical protein
MPALNAFMNIWHIEEARLMGINRNVDELAFFKINLQAEGCLIYVCGCPTRQWEHVLFIRAFHQG